jgi:hypothetical protein
LKSAWEIVCETLSQKHPLQERAGGVAQVVEQLPSTHRPRVQIPALQKNGYLGHEWVFCG